MTQTRRRSFNPFRPVIWVFKLIGKIFKGIGKLLGEIFDAIGDIF